MDQLFFNTVISILEGNIDHFCCFMFKANRIRKDDSRKGNVPFWVEVVKINSRRMRTINKWRGR